MTVINRSSLRPRGQRPSPPPLSSGNPNRFLVYIIVAVFIGFWGFAWSLERVDLVANPPQWWDFLIPFFPLPAFLANIFGFFHWRVLRHFIPVIVGGRLAYEAAVSLIHVLYDLPDRDGAKRFFSRLRTGVPPRTSVALNRLTLDADRQQFVVLRIGGPGRVTIKRGEVAVTELNGRFYKMRTHGTHILDRFEYVYTVLDLHPQERFAEEVHLITQDGIPFTANVHVRFQLSTGGTPPISNHPFPFDETAVELAAYNETILADGSKSSWDNIPLTRVSANLSRQMRQMQLNQILANANNDTEPLLIIRDAIERETRATLRTIGIELLSVHIGHLAFPSTVTEQYIQYWQSDSEARIRVAEAAGKATALKETEIARAEAEVTMIQAILEGVERARYGTQSASMREVVALRMIEALEKMARQSQQLQPIPTDLLSQLGTLRQQLTSGSPHPTNEGDDAP
ncbi:MAG: hypothetical protein GY943_14095 [Chloroflexi bacterium]|nr:hypothetical protein [Chloroflexota bacterium]